MENGRHLIKLHIRIRINMNIEKRLFSVYYFIDPAKHESKGGRETDADEIDSIGRLLLWPSKHDEWQAKKLYMQILTIATLPGLKDYLKYFHIYCQFIMKLVFVAIIFETFKMPHTLYLRLLQYEKLVVIDLRPLLLIIKLHFVPKHETQL